MNTIMCLKANRIISTFPLKSDHLELPIEEVARGMSENN